jgi:hypothetical protein
VVLAVPTGSIASPSQRTKNDASSPDSISSITTLPSPPAKTGSSAASASSTVCATVTPLPAASPSALTTIGAPAAPMGPRLLVRRTAPSRRRRPAGVADLLGEGLGRLERRRLLRGPEDQHPAARSRSATPARAAPRAPRSRGPPRSPRRTAPPRPVEDVEAAHSAPARSPDCPARRSAGRIWGSA